LNHILCKSAKESNVTIGFSLSSILNAKNEHVALGRMMQNIKMCRKFRVKTIIASFAQKPFDMRSVHDLRSLFEILGCKNPAFLKEPT
jgi:RNase P/RNase MRP subunit p30